MGKSNHISGCKRFCLFYTKNLLFLFCTINFTKHTHQSIYYTLYLIQIIFLYSFFNINLPTGLFFQYFLFFLLLSFSLSLSFPLSFLPLLSSSFSHVQNLEAPKQELHQHHSHHKHHNASPIHRSLSTQKHHHKHSINTNLCQPTKLISINPSLISINTDLHHRSKSALQSTIHNH